MVAEASSVISEHQNTFRGPVFLVGMPRSGTKLLRGLLNGHSKISIPRVETEFLPYWVKTWPRYGDLSKPENFKQFYQEAIKLPYFVHIQTRSTIIPEEVWYELCDGDFSPAGVFEALIRHKSDIARGSDGIWGDKSPSYIKHMPLLKQLYPNACFIHIIRDARDYCLSMQKAWGKHPIRAAQRWADDIQQARQDAQPFSDSYLEVKYEHLLEQPEAVLQQCCTLLGLEFEPEMVERAYLAEGRGDASGYSSIKQDNKQKYKTKMSASLRQRIEKISGHVLQTCGYETEYFNEPVRVSTLEMYYCQALDGIGLVFSNLSKRGFFGSLIFQWRYFKSSGNQN